MAPAPASCSARLPMGCRRRAGPRASGTWELLSAPQGGGVCALGTRQGACGSRQQQDSSRSRPSWAPRARWRRLCWGRQARRRSDRAPERGPPLQGVCSSLALLSTRLSCRMCCAQGLGPRAISARGALSACSPRPPSPPSLGPATLRLPWCKAGEEARARRPAEVQGHVCPAPGPAQCLPQDHAPGSGAAPGKAARGALCHPGRSPAEV